MPTEPAFYIASITQILKYLLQVSFFIAQSKVTMLVNLKTNPTF